MAQTERISTLGIRDRLGALSARRDWLLVAAASLNFVGYLGWFLVLHLRSLGWAPGQVLDQFPSYWDWFYRTFWSVDEVFAVRRSLLAVRHPALQLAAWLVVVTGYVMLLGRLRTSRSLTLRSLVCLALLFSLPLLVVPNLLSGDVYSYISFGRIGAVYGGNPFIDPPAAYPADPYFHWVSWTTVPSVYGPAWIYPSMVLTAVVEATIPHVVTYVLAYKVLALLLHLVNGLLIWAILDMWRRPQQVWGTALYLLNPLALIEFAGNAHNDVMMITFVLLAIFLHLRGHWRAAIGSLTLAVLVKWVALPILGLYGLLLLWQACSWGERTRYAVSAASIVIVLCVGLYAPYWEANGGWDNPAGRYTLRVLFDAPPQKRLVNSLGEMIASEYGRWMWLHGKWPNPALVEMVPATGIGSPLGDNTERDSWRAQQQQKYNRYVRDQRRARDQVITGQKAVQERIRSAGLWLLGVVCVVFAMLTRSLRSMLLASAWILFSYTAFAAVWVWPWYATWFVALAALLDWRTTARTAVLMSLLALLIYPLYPIMPEPEWWGRFRALIAWGVPLGFALVQGVRSLRSGVRQAIVVVDAEQRALT